MRIETINAFSYEEAKAKAQEMGLNVIKNVTSSFKKQNPVDVKSFAKDMFERDHITDVEGIAYMVVVEQGTPDNRMRPYVIKNNVPTGNMTKKRVFELRTFDTDKYVGEAASKSEALKLAKQRMPEFKEDIVCRVLYRVDTDHETAFMAKYAPGISTKLGTYIVFGNN